MPTTQINTRIDVEAKASGDGAQAAARILAAESGPGIYQRALAETGASPDRSGAQLDYDELLAQASFEKMAESNVGCGAGC